MFRFYIILLIISTTFINASNITPIPQKIEYNLKKALLGKKLFFDKRLSIDNTISCASCHDLENGGDDGLQVSVGVDGKQGSINAPTVLNAVFNFTQFWDGRAKNLEEQALGPIENPLEMAHDFTILVKNLKKTEYSNKFKKVYRDGITKKNIANAIAEFEKTLITPNSRFDKFLLGDNNALSAYEKEGFEIFKNKGCVTCHHGVNLGGNHFNRFGAVINIESTSLGRFDITKNKDDMYYFKVPTLRNIELTAPYFHNGSEDSLKKAVEMMALIQLGHPAKNEEIEKIVAFLKTLNGKLEVIE